MLGGTAEARALAAAQEGTAKVLARAQAAEAQAAKAAGGNGATGTARRAAKPASAAMEVASAPASGTGPQLAVKGLDAPKPQQNLSYSAPSLDSSAKESGPAKAAKTATVSGGKEPSRNAPCPCGSGKKYKFCHGASR